MNRATVESIIAALEAGKTPSLQVEALSADAAQKIAAGMTVADIPVFQRALRAIDEHDLAWLGFKVVENADVAMSNVDNEVTKKFGDAGSANGESFVFFMNDAKDCVCAHEYSARDLMQMKDVTRGPAMHNYQFDGLYWQAEPLFQAKHVWLLGASDVACELAKLAKHVGFQVTVCDYDPVYINAERFPDAHLVFFGGGNFDDLQKYAAAPADYVCVLTRGHMYDPQSCAWAAKCGAHYIGMMGCKGKNETVHDLVIGLGASEEDWNRIKRPIGLKFGAKTPAELAIAIVAELIDVRYQENYSAEARAMHEAHIR